MWNWLIFNGCRCGFSSIESGANVDFFIEIGCKCGLYPLISGANVEISRVQMWIMPFDGCKSGELRVQMWKLCFSIHSLPLINPEKG